MAKKILIAEDDKFLANAYRVKFAAMGMDVLIVNNGQEVLDKVDEYSPDVILMDLIMPIKDGFETLVELKKSDAHKSTPVVIASNLGQNEDIEKGIKLGAVDYIVKSNMSIKDLSEKILAITESSK